MYDAGGTDTSPGSFDCDCDSDIFGSDVSLQVNVSGSMEMDGSIIDDSMVCQDYGNDSFENAEV
jgi:hypothetical protein